LVFCPCGVFEVTIEVVEMLTAFAHGSPPGTRHATVRVPGGWRRARAARVLDVCVKGRAGTCPHGNQGQQTVVRRRLAARSTAKRPSCQGVC
jgi:hypothetical protein